MHPDCKRKQTNVFLCIRMANEIKALFFVYPDGTRNQTNVFFVIRKASAIKPLLLFYLSGPIHIANAMQLMCCYLSG